MYHTRNYNPLSVTVAMTSFMTVALVPVEEEVVVDEGSSDAENVGGALTEVDGGTEGSSDAE